MFSSSDPCKQCNRKYMCSRDHEVGGKYATNNIVRNYVSGSLIDVKILLTANHVGFMELRLCPILDSSSEVTQECLDKNLLHREAHLPDSLSWSHCVLQWRYQAGNHWGTDIETGKSCLGCGHQEEFHNCADISIAPKDNNLLLPLPTTTTTHEPLFVFSIF
ncbi:unnamed protein product [Rotaria sp. Silwood1]|nr:unnamed protein product [Rotaria sp. Silwood1]CAF4755321.1 unnamed protein product [Rotaria sp. Silwood1]